MKNLHILILAISFASAANAKEITYREFLANNQANIAKVSVGMSEAQVKSIMGSDTSKVKNGPLDNPWKIEHLGSSTVYHYLTNKNPPFTPILENQATPVLFKNGKVVGTGRAYIKEFRKETSSESSDTSGGKSIEERMSTLNNLFKSGAIDKATYEAKKKEILDEI